MQRASLNLLRRSFETTALCIKRYRANILSKHSGVHLSEILFIQKRPDSQRIPYLQNIT